MKFYKCNLCGNIITKLEDKGTPVSCCGQEMEELIPGAVDAAVEKHVPVVQVDGKVVSIAVGEVAHPMTEAHLIQWIALETSAGVHVKYLDASQEARGEFVLAEDEKAVCAYEYCNLHGLWKKEI